MHIHVQAPEGEAKFWLEPGIDLALASIEHPQRFPLMSKR